MSIMQVISQGMQCAACLKKRSSYHCMILPVKDSSEEKNVFKVISIRHVNNIPLSSKEEKSALSTQAVHTISLALRPMSQMLRLKQLWLTWLVEWVTNAELGA